MTRDRSARATDPRATARASGAATVAGGLLLSLVLGGGGAGAQSFGQPQQSQQKELPPKLQEAHQAYVEFRDEEALQLVTEFLLRNQGDPEGHFVRALCLRNLGRYQQVVAELSALESLDQRGKLLLLECRALVDAASVNEGIAQLDAMLIDDPEVAAARITRAKLLLRVGRMQEALTELRTVTSLDAKSAEAALLFGPDRAAPLALQRVAGDIPALGDGAEELRTDGPARAARRGPRHG